MSEKHNKTEVAGSPTLHRDQAPASYYQTGRYDTKRGFCSYWQQIHEIQRCGGTQVTEVGIGTGFVSRYLRQLGLEVTTVDIEEGLSPDFVGSITELPLPDNSCDVAVCYEVLEHLPYENFSIGLSELKRVSKGTVIISVPDASRCYRLSGRLCFGIKFKWAIQPPNPRARKLPENGPHYWEVGTRGYPPQKNYCDDPCCWA
jgi:SAM-dependent methyltransferase